MSRSTSRRRAAGIGVGALAAVVLAAPSALAQTESVLLQPVEESVAGYITAFPTTGEVDGDEEVVDEVVEVPASGVVSFALATGLTGADGDVVAGLVDQDDYDAFLLGESVEAPTPFFTDLEVALVEVDGVPGVDVTIPVDDPELADVDEAYLVVEGVVVDLLGTPSPIAVAVDLFPAGETDPATVATSLSFVGALPDALELQAGESFSVQLPADGLLPEAGVTSLDDIAVFLFSTDELEGLEASGVEDLLALGADAGAGIAALAEDDPDEEALEDFPLVEADGSEAVVTLAEEQPAGSYEVYFLSFAEEALASVVLTAEAEVTAAAVEPEPSPEPTATATAAPVPTPTATAPPRRNPGLRSNTGVETAAVPGLSDGQLAGLGGGLLALGTVGGVAVVRTQRRGRG